MCELYRIRETKLNAMVWPANNYHLPLNMQYFLSMFKAEMRGLAYAIF
jgi:hypothetical protein